MKVEAGKMNCSMKIEADRRGTKAYMDSRYAGNRV